MPDTMAAFTERALVAHAESVARGEHDEQCEYGTRPNGKTLLLLCHCSKRKREAEGYTTPPGELIHRTPMCPRCYGDTGFDGDVWTCEPCKVIWPSDTGPAEFTDDYGDLSH